MNPEQFEKFLDALAHMAGPIINIAESITQIEHHLDVLAEAAVRQAGATAGTPNYQRDLATFPTFDWATINAVVVKEDSYGPTVLEWNGKAYTRRSPQNKFGEAVWFSRACGKDEEGNNKYEVLIRFKEFAEADDLPGKVVRKMADASRDSGRLTQPVPPPPAPRVPERKAEPQRQNVATEKPAPARPTAVPPAGQPVSQALMAAWRMAKAKAARVGLNEQALVAKIGETMLIPKLKLADIANFTNEDMTRALGIAGDLTTEAEEQWAMEHEADSAQLQEAIGV